MASVDGLRGYRARHGELPPAAGRGAQSFYAESEGERPLRRVCVGTSCLLRGQDVDAVLGDPGCRAVSCLGHCDRSPASLDPAGAVQAASDSGPDVRCLAPEPIVTRRLAGEGCQELEPARAAGAYAALESALRGRPEAVIAELDVSGERGRGGAGFSTAAKWRACAEADGPERYAVANGDEGDPGSFVDRLLMERDPHGILEGLLLCGFAIGAGRGMVFVRAEYPAAARSMEAAIEAARAAGILGPSVLGSDFAFDVSLVRGRGSYVCGEETALLNAIEGLRGEVRLRPPYPVASGLYERPTVVNNVETLVNVPAILARGGRAYAELGTDACSGTKALCLNAGFARPGLVEVEFGTRLAAVIEEAGGAADGAGLEAVLVGGPMGSVVTPDRLDVPLCYAAMEERGIALGHGGLVAVPRGADLRALLRHWLRFMRDESCGRCAPCSLGSARAFELASSDPGPGERDALLALCELMQDASLCAFGQRVPVPVRELVTSFGDRIFAEGTR